MLLPALCPPSRRAPLPPSLFASPPASPSQSTTSHSALLATCRALQSMLASPQPQTQLPTPPMRHAPLPSPMKLRLRSSTSRPSSSDTSAAAVVEAPLPSKPIPRKRIAKRAPPRGGGKRRRGVVEEEGEEEEGPRTPKRSRGVPEMMPLGLVRGDFERLHDAHQYRSEGGEADALGIVGGPVGDTSGVVEEGGEGDEGEWTDEEDRVLVELVLEKLKLSRREWMDCAKMVGRDRGSVGRRWKSLVGGGEVGLKRRCRERGELPGTWR